MVSYDSDSSGDEDQEFTETDVLLGYASKDANGETISRLGGRPEWIDAKKTPSAALARCKICNDLAVLLLQLNAELPDRFPGHERRLYVFACKRKSCRRRAGSLRAIRGVRIAEDAREVAAPARGGAETGKPAKSTTTTTTTTTTPTTTAAVSSGLGEALFGAKPLGGGGKTAQANPFSSPLGANPFSTSSSSSSSFAAAANPFSIPASKPEQKPEVAPQEASQNKDAIASLPKSFAETLALNNNSPQTTTHGPPPPPEPWPEESAQPAPYPISWLSEAEYETLDPTPTPAPRYSTMDVDSGEGGGAGKEDKEVFESSMDGTFQKFADRVGQNPEQCIRYEFGGQPLLYSKSDTVGALLHTGGDGGKVAVGKGMPRCHNCGAGRVFEVQLTPHAIEELEGEDLNLDGMDWGTIIVGVCEKDCQERGTSPGEASYLEEWVGVQWEELAAKR